MSRASRRIRPAIVVACFVAFFTYMNSLDEEDDTNEDNARGPAAIVTTRL